jgi:hypothetical protein
MATNNRQKVKMAIQMKKILVCCYLMTTKKNPQNIGETFLIDQPYKYLEELKGDKLNLRTEIPSLIEQGYITRVGNKHYQCTQKSTYDLIYSFSNSLNYQEVFEAMTTEIT